MRILKNSSFDFMGKKSIALAISATIVLAGIGSLVLNGGPKLSIDFKGGTFVAVEYTENIMVEDVRSKMGELNIDGQKFDFSKEEVKHFGINSAVSVRVPHIENSPSNFAQKIAVHLFESFPDKRPETMTEFVLSKGIISPKIGSELSGKAVMAIFSALALILLYISIRFEFKFALGAIAALTHDVLITLGIFSLLSYEISLPIIAAFLTIVGYSLNDTIVIFDSLWIKTNKGMTRTLVNEISTFIEVYENEQTNKKELLDLFSIFLDLNIEYTSEEKLQNTDTERWFSPIDRTLRRELKSKFGLNEYWFDTTSYKELIDLRIKYKEGYFKFLVPKDRVASSSARIFALWITVPAFIMVIISLIFLKNQTRPITNLARAAERFGKGEKIEEFKPSGALEIRQAGQEFDKMRKRIERHINQRTEMLSGISHDLRTPLTRMKLQLAFIKDKETVEKLTEDINEMEKMLNEYLQFTSSSYVEKDEMFNLSELISQVVEKYNNENISKNLIPRIYFNGRKNLINRCINNLIDNAIKYANKVEITLNKKNSNLFIIIDDDGPGISKKEYENVFKPFYKIDKGRADSKSSVGLGLSISSDIIKSHGGNIMLEKSKMDGLRVKIFLPV